MNKHEKWLQACDQMAQMFSTCSKRQYAAFILAPNNRVVGFGYNGSPPGHAHCDQGGCPRLQQNSSPGSSYDNCIANHAEANALLWSDINSRQGGTLIINGPPCFGCSKLIASSGISRLVHYSDPTYSQWPECVDLLLESDIEIFSYKRAEKPFTPYFTTTEAFPPQWTQVTTSWPGKGVPYTPPASPPCDVDDWEPPSGPIYRGLLPDFPNPRNYPDHP